MCHWKNWYRKITSIGIWNEPLTCHVCGNSCKRPMQVVAVQTHYVVDGGKAQIILAALVAPAEVMENQPMRDLVFRTCFRWKLRPRQITGDRTYGTEENSVALETQHIRA